jgi:hypothetical protein
MSVEETFKPTDTKHASMIIPSRPKNVMTSRRTLFLERDGRPDRLHSGVNTRGRDSALLGFDKIAWPLTH